MEEDISLSETQNGLLASSGNRPVKVCLLREYTMEGVVDYLESRWAAMNIERSKWESDRAELETKVTALQNEVKNHEALKRDLARRIKMLEYALKQERLKHEGTEESNGTALSRQIERQLLDKCLSEISQDSALGLERKSYANTVCRVTNKPISSPHTSRSAQNQPERSPTSKRSFEEMDSDTAEALAELETNIDLHSTPSSSTNDETIVSQFKEKYRIGRGRPVEPPSCAKPLSSSHRNWLGNPANAPAPVQVSPAYLSFKDIDLEVDEGPTGAVTLPMVDAPIESAPPAVSARSCQSTDFSLENLADLRGEGGCNTSLSLEAARAKVMDNIDGVIGILSNSPFQSEVPPRLNGHGNSSSNSLSSSTTSLNSVTSVIPASNAASQKPLWEAKYSLRSHFDAIRQIVFHPSENCLVTASEDHTVKLWNLSKHVQVKRSTVLDVEPLYTCRGHEAPVLCLDLCAINPPAKLGKLRNCLYEAPATRQSFEPSLLIFSGDLDGVIRSWALPATAQLDPYEVYNGAYAGPSLVGHQEAVWAVRAIPGEASLVSISADGTARLWPFADLTHLDLRVASGAGESARRPIKSSHAYDLCSLCPELQSRGPSCVPCSLELLGQGPNSSKPDSFAVGFTTGDICIVSLDTGKLIAHLDTHKYAKQGPQSGEAPRMGSVNAMAIHPTRGLLFTGHEDKQLRFFDLRSAECVHAMVAHMDAVSSVAVEPLQGLTICSGSHDSSVRLWSLAQRACVQEITPHRFKHDEAVNSVAFYSTAPLLASAGADSVARVYV